MTNGEMKDSVGKRVHIDVFNVLGDLVEKGVVEVLTSPIVLEEFDRNKTWAYKHVNRLEGYKTEKKNYLKNHKDTLSEDEQNEIHSQIENCVSEIKLNREHIEDVERFLKTKTTSVPLTESVKIKCFNHALAKKAPFTGKKSNSMADMAILLSAVEYVDSNLSIEVSDGYKIRPNSIFISGNTTDFSQDKSENKEKVHPDLKLFFSSVDMDYSISLGTTLNSLSEYKIAEEEIEEMDSLLPYDYDVCPICAGWYEGLGVLDFNSYATLIDESITKPAPKEQLVIPFEFSEEDGELPRNAPKRESSILLSQCNWCNSEFFLCPVCDNMIMIEDEMECDVCETKFEYEEIRDRKGFLIKQVVHMLGSSQTQM